MSFSKIPSSNVVVAIVALGGYKASFRPLNLDYLSLFSTRSNRQKLPQLLRFAHRPSRRPNKPPTTPPPPNSHPSAAFIRVRHTDAIMSSSSDFTEVSHTASRPCPTKKCQKLLRIVNCPPCRALGTTCIGLMRCSALDAWTHALEDKLLWDKFGTEEWEDRERQCDNCVAKANLPASSGPCTAPESSLVEDHSHNEAVKRSIAAAAANRVTSEDAHTEEETDPRFDLFTVGSDTGETITTQAKSSSGEPAEEGWWNLVGAWVEEDPEGYSSSGESGLHIWEDLGDRPRSVLLDSDEEPTPAPSPEPEQIPKAIQPESAAELSEPASPQAASSDAANTDREAQMAALWVEDPGAIGIFPSTPPSPALTAASAASVDSEAALSAPASVSNMLAEAMENLLVADRPAQEAAPATEDQDVATPWRENPEITSPPPSPAPSNAPESEHSDAEGSNSSGSASFWLAALSDAFGGIAIEDVENEVQFPPLHGEPEWAISSQLSDEGSWTAVFSRRASGVFSAAAEEFLAHSPVAPEFVPLPLSRESSVLGVQACTSI
ncbi:hypothetical protein CC79DRAFT_1392391 [Sarocladium strictum]